MAEGSDQRRPRTKSMLSFTSSKKHKRSGSFSKADLIETSKEKAANRTTSKADPTKAMNEVQPGKRCCSQALWKQINDCSCRGSWKVHDGIHPVDPASGYQRRHYRYEFCYPKGIRGILTRLQPTLIDPIPHALDLSDPLILYGHSKPQLTEPTPVDPSPEQVRGTPVWVTNLWTSKLTNFTCRLWSHESAESPQ